MPGAERHAVRPGGLVVWIEADNVSLKLVTPAASPTGEVPEVVRLHRMPLTLARAAHHDRPAGQVDPLDQRRSADEESYLAGSKQPLDLEPKQRGHVAEVE